MNVARAELTELEGAVLSEIHDRAHTTAFQVRRAFQASPSVEWSGSAGAVYPAIRRLTEGGLISTEKLPGGRQAMALRLSKTGVAALQAWACDAARAAGVGSDPFRLRSGIWLRLDDEHRRAALGSTAGAIEASIAFHEQAMASQDAVEQTRMALAIRLQRVRLEWIAEQLG
jgi:DNA-binding PadR family transcriptional regulator